MAVFDRPVGWREFELASQGAGGIGTYKVRIRSYGWPTVALSIACYVDSDETRGSHNALIIRNAVGAYGGIKTPWREKSTSPLGAHYRAPIYWRLPVVPALPGFVVDVSFYAALSWLLFFAPFTLRRVVRARRGRCLKCGYDMRGLDACPECGAET
jgi:hypothetical protein